MLSYYKSQEDVNNGCKGSIKMSACDIKGSDMGFTSQKLCVLLLCVSLFTSNRDCLFLRPDHSLRTVPKFECCKL